MSRDRPEARKAFKRATASALRAIIICAAPIALQMTPACSAAQPPQAIGKKLKGQNLHWDPPALDSPISSLASSPSCVLGKILLKAGERANELVNNLQNFTAQEEIAYQTSDRMDFVKNHGSETFDYVVVFQPSPGGLVIQEKRNPTHGSILSAPAAQDMGLPEMVLLFLPSMQDDYEMTCEGEAKWHDESVSTVYFQQRRDKPSRTFSVRVGDTVYPAGLKGRAWIATESGEVVHMETGLMEGVPAAKIKHWYLSIDYVPIQFRTQPIKIWLPQAVDGYCDYGDRRTIVYHTFSNFMLFSVQTDQEIEKPKNP